MNIAAVFGRFNPPTCEHEALLDLLMDQQVEERYIFVFGGTEKTLPLMERISVLNNLYPACNVLNGVAMFRHGIHDAIRWMDAKHIGCRLTMIGGTGTLGIQNKEGGSVEELRRCFDNIPSRDIRFRNVSFIGNPRGTISGSMVRSMARDLKRGDRKQLGVIVNHLHSRIDRITANNIVLSFRKETADIE